MRQWADLMRRCSRELEPAGPLFISCRNTDRYSHHGPKLARRPKRLHSEREKGEEANAKLCCEGGARKSPLFQGWQLARVCAWLRGWVAATTGHIVSHRLSIGSWGVRRCEASFAHRLGIAHTRLVAWRLALPAQAMLASAPRAPSCQVANRRSRSEAAMAAPIGQEKRAKPDASDSDVLRAVAVGGAAAGRRSGAAQREERVGILPAHRPHLKRSFPPHLHLALALALCLVLSNAMAYRNGAQPSSGNSPLPQQARSLPHVQQPTNQMAYGAQYAAPMGYNMNIPNNHGPLAYGFSAAGQGGFAQSQGEFLP
ncbi:hypothetical protein L1887_43645 [Cichorium endivia]|nr:hypothetical protein L1887_43645 [Cichorium endivia]